MNKIEVGIVAGAAGLLAGFVGGYIFCRFKLGKQLEEELNLAIDDECAKLREEHEKMLRVEEETDIQSEIPATVFEKFASGGNVNPVSYEEVRDILAQMRASGERTDADAYPEEEGESDDEDGEEPTDIPPESDEIELIGEIGLEDYLNPPSGFEQFEMRYLLGDGVLLDSEDHVIDNPEHWVGYIPSEYDEQTACTLFIINYRESVVLSVDLLATDSETYFGGAPGL